MSNQLKTTHCEDSTRRLAVQLRVLAEELECGTVKLYDASMGIQTHPAEVTMTWKIEVGYPRTDCNVKAV